MYKILKLNKIHEKAENILNKGYLLSNNEENPDGIIVRSYKMHDYIPKDNLVAVARAGAGVNNIPVDKYKDMGIVVFNTPGANANAVKELVICSLFLASRDIIKGINWTSSLKGKGAEVGPAVEKGKVAFGGTEILGKTLGIVGLGAIGSMVAQAALALGMKVIGYDPYLTVDTAWTLNSEIKHAKELNYLYANSDFISIHSPLTEDTREMINAASIRKMKEGVSIINCARNELVCNKDLLEGIQLGKIRKYVTDFPSDDLIDCENVITIPHLGASTEEAETNCAIMAANELKEYLENGNIINSVNYPNLSAERTGEYRITINLSADSSAAIKGAEVLKGYGITGSISSTRNNAAYAIIDLANKPDADVLDKLKALDGVKKLRVIK